MERQVITLAVSYHPSGNRTLTQKVGEEMPRDLHDGVFANPDKGEFYRAVARKIMELVDAGHKVTYRDTTLDR